ncbi:hypothetical protein HUW63_31105 [Myxococcus sp. AM001]|nr:hypothetical protein [Myxococcus sp. AM001]
MRPARPPGWEVRLLAIASLAVACASPSFFITGDAPPKPSGPPARAIVLACDEAPRRVVVPEAAFLRALGPLDVDVMDPLSGTPRAKDATPPSNIQEVPAKAMLEVKVQGMVKSGNDWGALCFCRSRWGTCTPDCEDAASRIDVRVTCPATRFAKREGPGHISSPLPAHLPVQLTCTRSHETSKPLHCAPTLVALEDAGLSVFGALKLAQEAAGTKAHAEIVFSEAERGGPPQPSAAAFLCLRSACSNPAYYLPLEVTFKPPPRPAPPVSTSPEVPPVDTCCMTRAYCTKSAVHPAE